MKHACYLLACLLASLTLSSLEAQTPDWQWTARAGGSGSDCQATAVCTDDDGNIYVAGFFDAPVTIGDDSHTCSGVVDIFVAKLDPQGEWLWSSKVGGPGYDKPESIALDHEGNLIVTGQFSESIFFGSLPILTSSGSRDVFVAKITSNGAWLWATRGGGTGTDVANGVAVDNSGSIYVTGQFYSTASFGSSSVSSAGTGDIFLAKLNNSGIWVWAKRAGSTSSDRGEDVSVDPSGNVIVAGKYNGTVSFGAHQITAVASNPVFVAKCDPQGSWQWAISSSGNSLTGLGDMCLDALGNAYVTGYFNATAVFGDHSFLTNGGTSIYVAKASPDGTWLWAYQGGGPNDDNVSGIACDNAGNLWIAGTFEFPILFGDLSLSAAGVYDLYMAKLSQSGTWTWATRTGGTASEYFGDFHLDDQGNVYICGGFDGFTTLGYTSLDALGDTDAYVLKYGLPAGLLPPEALNISKDQDSVQISWDPVAGAASYRVEASDLPSGPFTDISAQGVFAGASFSVDLSDAVRKYYRVIALDH